MTINAPINNIPYNNLLYFIRTQFKSNKRLALGCHIALFHFFFPFFFPFFFFPSLLHAQLTKKISFFFLFLLFHCPPNNGLSTVAFLCHFQTLLQFIGHCKMYGMYVDCLFFYFVLFCAQRQLKFSFFFLISDHFLTIVCVLFLVASDPDER